MRKIETEIVIDEKLRPDDVLDYEQFESMAEAVADYLSEMTGYCVESLSIGLDVTYTLDTSYEEGKQ